MQIIGLTGGIASGKSAVSGVLADLGAVIIDGDKTAHSLMEPDQPSWHDIVKNFGPEILNPNRTIDRARLGAIVFDDPERMDVLNRITRPRITERFKELLQQARAAQTEVVVMDIPLLFEVKLDKLCDQVWVVWVDRQTQLERLMERNGLTREDALKRINSQMSLDEKAARADLIIDNNGELEKTINLATRYYLDILPK